MTALDDTATTPALDDGVTVQLPSRKGAVLLEQLLRSELEAQDRASTGGRRRAEPDPEAAATAEDLRRLCDALRDQLAD